MGDTVKVDLPTAVIYRGTAYGPGEGVDVPTDVAQAAGLTGEKKAAKAAKKATKKGRK
jgi:hypothetical protein